MLVNNGGGAIFDYLPVSREHDVYEQHVATATGLDFARAAELFGLRHERPRTLDELRGLLGEPPPGVLIEVRTDRVAERRQCALHGRIWPAVAVALHREPALRPPAPAAAPRA